MSRPKVFVLALAGLSPAVVTELLWHLVRQEGKEVVGVELWTTADAHGLAGVAALTAARVSFRQLRTSLGDDARWLPELPLPAVDEVPGGPWDGRPFRVVALTDRSGRHLADVRGPDDADRVQELLHDRVRQLRSLPDGVSLVACLAGGRKTLSSALQTALVLQGRADDRLVHVLLHPEVEADLVARRELASFAVPDEEVARRTGVSVGEQLTVHDVWFPRLRQLVRGSLRLEARLDGDAYPSLWRRLTDHLDGRSVTLRPTRGQSWRIELHDDGEVAVWVRLSPLQAGLYARLVEHPAGLTAHELTALVRHPTSERTGTAERTLQRLSETLLSERFPEPLVPQVADKHWRLGAPERVTVFRPV